MSKLLKRLIGSCIMIGLLCIPGSCFASGGGAQDMTNATAKVTIINNDTGEIEVLTGAPVEVQSNSRTSSDICKDYTVFIPIGTENGVMPRSNEEHSKDQAGVNAVLKVNYDVNSTNEQVRVNSLSGSWTPSDSMYYLSDRVAAVHDGQGSGSHKLEKKPTSNSFSYTTGWGYHYRVWGAAAPRAWSEATIHISGMSATYRIVVEFTFS